MFVHSEQFDIIAVCDLHNLWSANIENYIQTVNTYIIDTSIHEYKFIIYNSLENIN